MYEKSKSSSMSVRQFLDAYPDNLRETCEYLRDLVRSVFPNVREKVYTGWKLLGYRLPDGNKTRYFCCIVPQRSMNDVLLGFQYGIAMQDPQHLMEGKGTQVRFVRLKYKDQYPDADLIWLIEEGANVALTR